MAAAGSILAAQEREEVGAATVPNFDVFAGDESACSVDADLDAFDAGGAREEVGAATVPNFDVFAGDESACSVDAGLAAFDTSGA